MAPPNVESKHHTSPNEFAITDYSIDSLGSFVDCEEVIKESIAENLEPHKNELEADGVDLNALLNQKISDLIKLYESVEHSIKHAELNDASDLVDLIKGQVAGFNKEQLLKMCTFSKISYGDGESKLEKEGFKTKKQFKDKGYQIIKFYENELIEDKYCLDSDYKLEEYSVDYALKANNSCTRDAGYIFIGENGEVTIAYHGTRDNKDDIHDLDAFLTEVQFSDEKVGSIHRGFYSLFKRSWPSVHKILQGLANDRGSAIKDLKINIAGHSMGGALATIAALCLKETEDAQDIHVATFGSPRVLYQDAAKVYSECFRNKTIRVAAQSDPIPCAPFGFGGQYYKHVGKPLKLETGNRLNFGDHGLSNYFKLINDIKQKTFKSDDAVSWYFYLGFITGKVFSNFPKSTQSSNDKEFFEKVKEENKDIKLSGVPLYVLKSEKESKQGEQEVAQRTNDKTQLEERLSSIQQNLDKKTKELDDKEGKLIQEQQKTHQLNDQVDKLTAEFKGTKDQLAEKKAELDEQISKVTKLNGTVEEFKGINAELERKNSNLTNQLEKLEGVKTKLEEKAEFTEETLKDAQDRLEELDTARRNVSQLKEELKQVQQNLAAKTKEFENTINTLEKGLNEKASEADQFRKVEAQFEQENRHLTNQIEELKRKCEQTEVQLVKSKQKLAEEVSKATQLNKESHKTKAQLEEKEKTTRKLNAQIDQLTAQNNQMEEQLNNTRQDLTNKISEVTQLKKAADTLNNNEELNDKNEKLLEIRTYSKKQIIYAAASFVSSAAFAVGASLTMLHLAICISLAVSALTSLAVGCYYS